MKEVSVKSIFILTHPQIKYIVVYKFIYTEMLTLLNDLAYLCFYVTWYKVCWTGQCTNSSV